MGQVVRYFLWILALRMSVSQNSHKFFSDKDYSLFLKIFLIIIFPFKALSCLRDLEAVGTALGERSAFFIHYGSHW